MFGQVDFDLASMPDEEKRQAAGRLFAELQALHTGEKTPTVLLREKKDVYKRQVLADTLVL